MMDAIQIAFVIGVLFGVALSTALYAHNTAKINK